MYTLRPYQSEAVDRAVDFFHTVGRDRPILELPTAAGKSLIIAFIVKRLKGAVLILQPSKELLEQNYRKYEEAIAGHPELESAGIYSASVGVKERRRVTFATIGSVEKKPELFADVEYVLIDECHEVPPKEDSMYVSFLNKLECVKVIGLTATPYRLKTYNYPYKHSKVNLLPRERPLFFNKFLYNVTVKQMYEQGYLCPLNYVPIKWDSSQLQLNSTGAEFSDDSMKRALERNMIMENIPSVVDQAFKKGRKSCLVFVRSVAEAQQLAAKVPFSEYLHALTPKKDRERIVKAFKSGGIKTIFNVAVLTRGFDHPALDTIIIARPTMSLALYVQMVGRGMRLAEGKDHCTIVEMCGNLQRFGKVEEMRIEEDPHLGWVLRNDRKIISGRKLEELV